MSTDVLRRHRYERLIEEIHDPVMRYLERRMNAHDADEVMSDVLLTLWRRLDAIPMPTPLPWCYGVARRAVANHRRAGYRRLALVQRLESQPRPQPGAEADDPELAAALTTALATLSPADREVITLWAWEGLEPREIAQVLETTPNAVSIRLSRSKARLARELGRKDPPLAGHNGSDDTGDRS